MDFFASERHFLDHLAPIAFAMGSRANVMVPSHLNSYAVKLGLQPINRLPGRRAVVASIGDLRKARVTKEVIFLEHGAGMTYDSNHPSYAGGRGRGRIVLYLATNEMVAANQQKAYPDQDVRVIGAPKLDRWFNGKMVEHEGQRVAISFHWDCKAFPETRSAFNHFEPALPEIVKSYEVLGHGHPRDWVAYSQYWGKVGAKRIRDFDNIMALADVYVADNSSTLYEFASTGRPVVVMNSPHYRRDVKHGLRFWDDIPGIQVDEPGDLKDAIADALKDSPHWKAERKRITSLLYPHQGKATELAVAAIREYDTKTHEHGVPFRL